MITFKFDKEKTIAALLYISSRLHQDKKESGFHAIFKILYFAERKHLSRYAMPITGDNYIAMEDGPVPSESYNIFKRAKTDKFWLPKVEQNLFEIDNWLVKPLQVPDMEELSESDLECLDESIEENKSLSYGQRVDKSHSIAWGNAQKNGKMDFCDIASEEGANKDVCDLIRLTSENEAFADSL